jgi:hypothetical protein
LLNAGMACREPARDHQGGCDAPLDDAFARVALAVGVGVGRDYAFVGQELKYPAEVVLRRPTTSGCRPVERP